MDDLKESRIKYPSVSEVYYPYMRGKYSGVSLDDLIKYQEIKDSVLSHCQAIVLNLWQIEIKEECRGYVNSFEKWRSENIAQFINADLVLYDDFNKFVGKIDFIVRLKGSEEIATVTLKTGQPSKSWELQLAAYSQLCKVNNLNTQKHFILKLSKEGKEPTLIEAKDITASYDIFHRALTLWKYFKEVEDVSA